MTRYISTVSGTAPQCRWKCRGYDTFSQECPAIMTLGTFNETDTVTSVAPIFTTRNHFMILFAGLIACQGRFVIGTNEWIQFAVITSCIL